MKRYLVFAYAIYYPNGGFGDLVGSTDDLDEAKTMLADTLDAAKQRAAQEALWDSGLEEPERPGCGWTDPYNREDGHIVDLTTGSMVRA